MKKADRLLVLKLILILLPKDRKRAGPICVLSRSKRNTTHLTKKGRLHSKSLRLKHQIKIKKTLKK